MSVHTWHGSPCARCGGAQEETWERTDGRWHFRHALCFGECTAVLSRLIRRVSGRSIRVGIVA